MVSKRILKKQTEEILRSLEEKAPLSTNPGKHIHRSQDPKKMTAKNRRHSGWVTPKWAGPGKYSEAIEEGNEPQVYWDDWNEYRDGLRYDDDPTHIRGIRNGYNKNSFQEEIVKANKKQRRLLAIRKAKKEKKNV